MNCVICGSDDWENVDQFRLKPEGMSICKHCGFVSYPSRWKSEAELKQYYRKDYRSAPKAGNFFSGQRKIHYHNAFLKELFDLWKSEERAKPAVCELGAAYGMFLNYVKEVVPDAEVFGTELTLTYRRNAYHEYGINLTEDFDHTRQYDLIASYKVAEHQFDIDKYLRQYVECLKPNGYFYISVPTWFGKLSNFGAAGFDIEYYYHPNHINVWTKKLFETLLKKVGLKVIKYNGTYYDDTYLCIRDDSLMELPPEYESVDEIKMALQKVHEAGVAYTEGRFDDAIKAWPDFPDAHVARYEGRRAEFNRVGLDEIKKQVIEFGFKSCGQSSEIYGLAGDILMRYDQWKDAIACFEKLLELRPGNGPALKGISHCLRQMAQKSMSSGDQKDAQSLFAQARDVMRYLRQVSAQDEHEALNWVYADNARIPTEFET